MYVLSDRPDRHPTFSTRFISLEAGSLSISTKDRSLHPFGAIWVFCGCFTIFPRGGRGGINVHGLIFADDN